MHNQPFQFSLNTQSVYGGVSENADAIVPSEIGSSGLTPEYVVPLSHNTILSEPEHGKLPHYDTSTKPSGFYWNLITAFSATSMNSFETRSWIGI